ncbi:Imm17 family immunity protein [Pseudoflavonifractor sp. MCC625]|uniref:Imm17 family immunity protein n=1 Tax=Pseudoflavonifractor sp. MCC625 TaxID=2592647 RepID=UPI001C0162DA|nr:Imm17 family immunity protein [Pseudoflavonifractor sp. MCC625]MBT9683186.1 cytochrome D ubiquinol oxidase subunit II [Pseudoflavonifractor sp. MCC625]
MEGAKFPAMLREHWHLIPLAIGILLLLGAILNWNWLCDPTGKPESHRYSRGSRRAIFFLLGIVLIVSSLWRCLLTL